MRTVRVGDTTHNTYFSHFSAPLGADSPGDEDGVQVLYKVPLVGKIVSKVVQVLSGHYPLPLLRDAVVNILREKFRELLELLIMTCAVSTLLFFQFS